MARYIDADLLASRIEYYCEHTYGSSGEHYAYNKAFCEIQRAPTADVVEVVRCCDCIYANKHYDTTHFIGNTFYASGVPTRLLYITCRYHRGKLAENDFCSYGERKTDNDL